MEPSHEQKIMKKIFLRPTTRFSYRELSRQSSVSVGTVSKLMPKLEKDRLVNIETMPNAKYATGNIENEHYRIQKRLFNISFLYETGLVEYISKKLRPKTIVLFGSFEKGHDTERSDIDICVIDGRKSEISLRLFEKIMHRPINIVRIASAKGERAEFKLALINGIILGGYLAI